MKESQLTEHQLLSLMLKHPSGYDVSLFEVLTIRSVEGGWAVVHDPTDPRAEGPWEELFEDPSEAATAFLDARDRLRLGDVPEVVDPWRLADAQGLQIGVGTLDDRTPPDGELWFSRVLFTAPDGAMSFLKKLRTEPMTVANKERRFEGCWVSQFNSSSTDEKVVVCEGLRLQYTQSVKRSPAY